MPTYEYVCNECKKVFEIAGTFEVLMHFNPTCPECNSDNVRKKISPVAFILKGDGFYKTGAQK